jgi:putative peptide zinc metalloprotease protein
MAGPDKTPAVAGEGITKGRFPARYRVVGVGPDGRCRVYDPLSTRRWALGAVELSVARQFDGMRSYDEIRAAVRGDSGRNVATERLAELEARLLALGLLEPAEYDYTSRGWTWFRVRWLRRLAETQLFSVDPQGVLHLVERRLRWLRSYVTVVVTVVFVILVLGIVTTRARQLWSEVPSAITGAGLVYLIVASVACAALHEGGHALACHRYGVPVESIGIGLHWLMPFAWTQPRQDAWSQLPLRRRLVTIVAGTMGSLVFAALGGALWLVAHDSEPLRLVGLFAILAGTVVSVPTLLPIFNGDGYLLLTEVTGRTNLRHKAFRHLMDTLTNPRRAACHRPSERVIYLSFALAAIAGRSAAALFVVWLLWNFSLRPVLS